MKRKEISEYIENLDIDDNLKQKLLLFNDKYQKMINYNLVFDIVIDKMTDKDINTLLEYIVDIMKKYGNFSKYIEYEENTKTSNISDSVIIINNFNIFNDEILECFRSKEAIADFFTTIRKNNNMLIFADNNDLKEKMSSIDTKYFDFGLVMHFQNEVDNEKEYKKLVNKYEINNVNYELTFDSFEKIASNLENKFINKISLSDYIYDYSLKKSIINGITIDQNLFENSKEENDKPMNTKIDDLVGLNNIKEHLDRMFKYVEFSKKLKQKETLYLNLFFLGNPGTGKTTVARLYAKKLYKLGLIDNDNLVEIVPNDLMGEYVGHTKRKTRQILDKAKGGVLFIDEAYLLYTDTYSKGKNPFMEEAVVELIKYLENPKNVVIFAGYPNEMRKIYDANPGLKSRIYDEIIFNDYTLNELYQILKNEVTKKGLKIDNSSKTKILNYINTIRNTKNFGNARSMKQLVEKMIMNHVNNNPNTLILDEKDLPKDEFEQVERMGFDKYGK